MRNQGMLELSEDMISRVLFWIPHSSTNGEGDNGGAIYTGEVWREMMYGLISLQRLAVDLAVGTSIDSPQVSKLLLRYDSSDNARTQDCRYQRPHPTDNCAIDHAHAVGHCAAAIGTTTRLAATQSQSSTGGGTSQVCITNVFAAELLETTNPRGRNNIARR